jgi:FMN-dependent NADH-azoreductase
MAKILHIEASQRGSQSGSSQLAAWFLSAVREAHPEDEIQVLNIFETDLPPFDEEAANAKFTAIFQEKLSRDSRHGSHETDRG